MVTTYGGDGKNPLHSLFEDLKLNGTAERLIKENKRSYYKRYFKVNQYSIYEAPKSNQNYRVCIVTWTADIIYSDNFKTASDIDDNIYKPPTECYIEWKAIFKDSGVGWVLEDLLFKYHSIDKMCDIKDIKDFNHYAYDWYYAIKGLD